MIVAHSEIFDGYTINLAELTEEQVAEMTETLAEDFTEAEISYTKTAYGTDLIVVDENGLYTDVCDIVTIYDGYVVSACILNVNGEITEDDKAVAIQLLSDMWFVKAE